MARLPTGIPRQRTPAQVQQREFEAFKVMTDYQALQGALASPAPLPPRDLPPGGLLSLNLYRHKLDSGEITQRSIGREVESTARAPLNLTGHYDIDISR